MKLKLLLFFVIPVILYSQTANEVIKNLQNKFAQTKTLQAEFSQSIYSPQSEKPTIFNGKFYYKKENSFSINLSGRDIVSDGISVWNFDKKQNKLVISPFETGNTAFSLNEIINSYPQKCKLTLVKKSESEFIIKSVPNDSFYSFKEAYLTINGKYLLSKIEIVDFNNMKYIFELFSIETNIEISKAKFKFNPTNEMEVIDLR